MSGKKGKSFYRCNGAISAVFLIGLMTVGVVHSCKLTLERLVPWQKETIKQLKVLVNSTDLELPHTYMHDDLYLARWLAAKVFQVEPAYELLKSNLKWRKEHRMDNILKENWKAMNSEYPYQITLDKENRPLLYIKLGGWNIAKMSTMMKLPELGRHFAKIIEEADLKVWKARAKGKNVSQFTILVNLEGYDLRKHGCLHCLSFYSTLGETLQAHFPRVAERVVFINAPPMFEVVFTTIQRILNIDARSSIDIFGPDRSRWEPAILQYLDESQFPRDLILQKEETNVEEKKEKRGKRKH